MSIGNCQATSVPVICEFGGRSDVGRSFQRFAIVEGGSSWDRTIKLACVDLALAGLLLTRAARSGAIHHQARAASAVNALLGRSRAGAQLVVATMDQDLEAIQRQLDQTTAQNRLLAVRLRALAAVYRGGPSDRPAQHPRTTPDPGSSHPRPNITTATPGHTRRATLTTQGSSSQLSLRGSGFGG
ncbi:MULTISPECIES: hypothetical protein [Mycobacterium]|uniref:Uncharacterized protein n=1 Tax=Mycobacterium servetii TaxID=3237418 RepID=A0ABV4C8M2_9MYCO